MFVCLIVLIVIVFDRLDRFRSLLVVFGRFGSLVDVAAALVGDALFFLADFVVVAFVSLDAADN